jgi:hypothetical protein
MSAKRLPGGIGRGVLPMLICGVVAACSSGSEAGKGAAEGAGIGAIAGAVGSMATALVFGGNVAEAGARGAVAGGSSGAVVGGMSGAKRDRQMAEQQAQAEQQAADTLQQELAGLRQRLGEDAYNGMVALANCKYGIADANAEVAMQSDNPDFALGGLWLSILTSADRRDEAKARARFPELIERDSKIGTEAEAEQAMRDALQRLMTIRETYDLPPVCPA